MASNLRVDSIVPATGSSVSIGTATGGVSIPGVLTYEDVTNVDSVGVITARSGIRIGATGANTLVQGTATGIGIGESSPLGKLHVKSADSGGSAHDGADELVVEGSGDSGISILSGASNNGRLNFGDSGDNNVGRLQYNHSDNYLAFYNTGTEKLRIGTAGQIGIAGANYGTSGQVLTSAGSGSAVQWATPASGWVHTATTALNGSSTLTLTGVPDGASHIRYLIRYMSCTSSTQPAFRVEKSTTGGSKSIITANYQSYAAYFGGNGTSGNGNSDRMDIFEGYTNALNNMFGTIDVYRVGTNGSDGTNYLFNHQGFVNYNGTLHACVQSNGYIELGTGSTDFISGAQFFNSNGVNFDNGHINQSHLLS